MNTTFANFVTAIWGPNVNTVNVTTTAIAAFPMLPGGQTCLLAVGSTNTFSVPAGATLNLPNCPLASLSILGNSIQLPSSGNPINAAAIATAGNVQTTDGSSPPPHTFTYFPLQDPYKSVATSFSAPPPPGPCVPWKGGTPILPGRYYCGITITDTNVTFSAGTYYIGSGGIRISGSSVVTFGPGLYYLYGESGDGYSFSITGLTGAASISGAGVTFVMTATPGSSAGGIDIDPGPACSATVSLSGTQTGQGLLQPSATASQGLLFFQDPSAVTGSTPGNTITSGASNNGCANVTLGGAIYTPASADTLQGNALANVKGCTELIAQSFTLGLGGNPALDDTGCSAAGITLNQPQIQQVYLAM